MVCQFVPFETQTILPVKTSCSTQNALIDIVHLENRLFHHWQKFKSLYENINESVSIDLARSFARSGYNRERDAILNYHSFVTWLALEIIQQATDKRQGFYKVRFEGKLKELAQEEFQVLKLSTIFPPFTIINGQLECCLTNFWVRFEKGDLGAYKFIFREAGKEGYYFLQIPETAENEYGKFQKTKKYLPYWVYGKVKNEKTMTRTLLLIKEKVEKTPTNLLPSGLLNAKKITSRHSVNNL
jgi:hypothetical protein